MDWEVQARISDVLHIEAAAGLASTRKIITFDLEGQFEPVERE